MESTENLTTKTNNGFSKIYLVLIVLALVIAIISLVVACIALSLRGDTNISYGGPTSSGSSSALSGSSGTYYGDDRIWSIAIGHQNDKKAYIHDESGTLKGFFVDLVTAVCAIGNKNCEVVYDVWSRCWDSQAGEVARGGQGLMSGWYDGCAGWVGTYERYRTYAFSIPFGRTDPESLYVKPGSPLKSGWQDGVPFVEDQIVHYQFPVDLTDAVMNDEVDYAFANSKTHTGENLERVDGDPVLPCAIHGNGVMTRKINHEFLDWWNPAQERLMATGQYERICQDLEDEHGKKST
ncbi:uncharacterized protein [Amphiura filiformis]|uniref:uncharacterized protein n=1 Tax=Amphiura filiformis TaxID=82378 RepID=UPI003B21F97A